MLDSEHNISESTRGRLPLVIVVSVRPVSVLQPVAALQLVVVIQHLPFRLVMLQRRRRPHTKEAFADM